MADFSKAHVASVDTGPVISLMGLYDDDSSDAEDGERRRQGYQQNFEVQEVEVCGQKLKVRQFDFHPKNANRLWPGTFVMAQYLLSLEHELQSRRILELGSATGLLSIFLHSRGFKSLVTSDADDKDIQDNIAHNFKLNGHDPVPHFPHNWGQGIPTDTLHFDVIVASDILLYVSAYPDLVKTLLTILENKPSRSFLMSWQRRIAASKEFFSMMRHAGFICTHEGHCIYTFAHGKMSDLAKGEEYWP